MGRFIQLRSIPVSFINEVREESALIIELDNNRIATLPVEVGHLAGLVSINLSRNGLTSLPVFKTFPTNETRRWMEFLSKAF